MDIKSKLKQLINFLRPMRLSLVKNLFDVAEISLAIAVNSGFTGSFLTIIECQFFINSLSLCVHVCLESEILLILP